MLALLYSSTAPLSQPSAEPSRARTSVLVDQEKKHTGLIFQLRPVFFVILSCECEVLHGSPTLLAAA